MHDLNLLILETKTKVLEGIQLNLQIESFNLAVPLEENSQCSGWCHRLTLRVLWTPVDSVDGSKRCRL